jgi:hypothetical protein
MSTPTRPGASALAWSATLSRAPPRLRHLSAGGCAWPAMALTSATTCGANTRGRPLRSRPARPRDPLPAGPLPPLRHRVDRHAQFVANINHIGPARPRQHHDPRPHHEPLVHREANARSSSTNPLLVAQRDCTRGSRCHPAASNRAGPAHAPYATPRRTRMYSPASVRVAMTPPVMTSRLFHVELPTAPSRAEVEDRPRMSRPANQALSTIRQGHHRCDLTSRR